MAYVKPYTVDFNPSGSTVKVGIQYCDDNIDQLFSDLNTHEALTTSAHGLTSGEGTIVGTASVDTLTNKTIQAPTLTGTVTCSGATLTGGTAVNMALTTPTITSPTLTGAITNTGGTISGGSVTNATIGTTCTLTGNTITTPSITGGTVNNPTITGAIVLNGTTSGSAVGTGAGNLVQLDGSAKLPAVDGSLLTNVALTLGSDADGDMYYRASSVLARLAKGAANSKLFMNAGATAPEWADGIKIANFSRDMASASGDVAYTGVGFKPSAVIFFASVAGAAGLSAGGSDATTHGCIFDAHINTASSWSYSAAICIYLLTASAGTYQCAIVKSMDADGFTLTWTKGNSPSGTAGGVYFAIR